MKSALEASKLATDDETLQRKAIKEVAKELGRISLDGIPLSISYRVLKIVREVTSTQDPYRKLKRESNEKAMNLYPSMKEKIEESEDRMLTATKIAIAGNIIDFGPDRDFDIEKTIENNLNGNFEIDHFKEFKKEIGEADNIVYLLDNAGEIVFDRLLLEELPEKNVRCFVRGFPMLNDAMRPEAEFAGIDKVAEIEEMEENIGLNKISEEFKSRLSNADVVVSKGQANYEAFSEVEANIFFLFMVKCPHVSRRVGAKEGSAIIKRTDSI